jgi:hypothetical protein
LTWSRIAKTNRLALGSNVATDDEEFPSFGLGHQRKDELQQTKSRGFRQSLADAGGKIRRIAGGLLSQLCCCVLEDLRTTGPRRFGRVGRGVDRGARQRAISSPSDRRRHKCFMHGRVSSSCSLASTLYTIADGRLDVTALRSPSIIKVCRPGVMLRPPAITAAEGSPSSTLAHCADSERRVGDPRAIPDSSPTSHGARPYRGCRYTLTKFGGIPRDGIQV